MLLVRSTSTSDPFLVRGLGDGAERHVHRVGSVFVSNFADDYDSHVCVRGRDLFSLRHICVRKLASWTAQLGAGFVFPLAAGIISFFLRSELFCACSRTLFFAGRADQVATSMVRGYYATVPSNHLFDNLLDAGSGELSHELIWPARELPAVGGEEDVTWRALMPAG